MMAIHVQLFVTVDRELCSSWLTFSPCSPTAGSALITQSPRRQIPIEFSPPRGLCMG